MAMIEITKKDYDDIESKIKKCIDHLQDSSNTILEQRSHLHDLVRISVD